MVCLKSQSQYSSNSGSTSAAVSTTLQHLFPPNKDTGYQNSQVLGWGYSAVVKRLPGMQEVLGSTPSTEREKGLRKVLLKIFQQSFLLQ